MNNDETAGRATGGVIPPGFGATEKHPHICNCYNNGGVLAPGMVLLRNDTGRMLRMDEAHLLTYVGPAPGGRVFTADEVRRMGLIFGERLLDEISEHVTDVDEGRAVPASPTVTEAVGIAINNHGSVVWEAPPAGTNTVTFGFDGSVDGETTLTAGDADGRLVQW